MTALICKLLESGGSAKLMMMYYHFISQSFMALHSLTGMTGFNKIAMLTNTISIFESY